MREFLATMAVVAFCGCAATTTPTVNVTINGKAYRLKEGASLSYRDPASGRYTPLTVKQ